LKNHEPGQCEDYGIGQEFKVIYQQV